MKLKNKKTGEIIEIYKGQILLHCNKGRKTIQFKSLEELEEWEDYEEPKEYCYITGRGNLHYIEDIDDEGDQERKEIGNYFETKEEAEKAVEKLKAWKRLKDKGFKFKGYTRKFDGFKRVDESVFITAELNDEGVIGMIDDLNICFGGEE
jgi:hypothetical protein